MSCRPLLKSIGPFSSRASFLLHFLLAALLLLYASSASTKRAAGRRYPNVRVISTHSSEGGYSGKEGYVELKACSF